MSRSRWAVALRALLILIAWSTWMSEDFLPFDPSESAEAGQYDRPAKNPHQSRSVVIAKHGIVATSHPLAAQAGLDILKKGGNAADAAAAALRYLSPSATDPATALQRIWEKDIPPAKEAAVIRALIQAAHEKLSTAKVEDLFTSPEVVDS